MAFDTYLQFILALLLVLGLIAILAWILRRFGLGGSLRPGNQKRLQILEAAAIGPRHRLVLVRRDRVEHLLLLGPQGDVVVESGIERAGFDQEMARKDMPPKDTPGEKRLAALRQDPPPLRTPSDAAPTRKDDFAS